MAIDTTVERDSAPILNGPNRLKLAVFGVNDNRGLVMTTAPGPPEATWPQSVSLTQEAERLGFEAIIPLARWRGYGGTRDLGGRCFETFTWAAGLAGLTESIQVFATFHVPTVHPVMAAKMVATIDHISHGRFGLNIVAGWQPEEIAMFGSPQRDHDERYEVSDEWAELVKRLWTESGSFDFRGRFFDSPGAFSEPKPLQTPHPVIMSAGISPAGRNFAAKHADLVFAAIVDPAQTGKTVAEIKQLARESYGRELRVFGRAHITCRETEAEARDAYEYFILEHGDREAGENVLRMLMEHSQTIDWSSAETQAFVEAVIRGYFAHPITGSPEQVAAALVELSEAGLDGVAITWNDYEEGLDQYERFLLPLLVDAGVRQPLQAPAAVA
jgi:alkanesulfonate monooxygenase SsuD/methylene tetrahydromethanopterin reductase-like flavin-dependent oxidoreductase (luciferase family)